MGNLSENFAMKNLRGKVADLLVYRSLYGDTIVCKVPKKPTTKTESQVVHRDKFRLASSYGRNQVNKPEVKALYEAGMNKKKRTAYLVAVSDYMVAPTISMIDTSAYTGAIGSEIGINAIDDFKVKQVEVEIQSATGETIEKGLAFFSTDLIDRWVYAATVANSVLAGAKVLVTAKDIAGNSTKEIVTI